MLTCFYIIYGKCTVIHGLVAIPLGVICSMNVAFSRHLLYYVLKPLVSACLGSEHKSMSILVVKTVKSI